MRYIRMVRQLASCWRESKHVKQATRLEFNVLVTPGV